MIKSTLSLGEVYNLVAEISGNTDKKGLMGQDIANIQKFWLSELLYTCLLHKTTVDGIRDNLIRKEGVKITDDQYTVPFTIDKLVEGKPVLKEDGTNEQIVNPKFVEFNTEFQKILNEEIVVEHYPFKIEDYDFKSTESFPVFYKLIKNSLEPAPKEPTKRTKKS